MLLISTIIKTHLRVGFCVSIMNILDFIFPKTCVNCGRVGTYLCNDCVEEIESFGTQICPVCTKPSISGVTHPRCSTKLSLDGLHSFVYYRAPVTKALYRLKYKFVKDLAVDLLGNISLNLPSFLESYTLITVPLHVRRENWRGFDHTQELANIISDKLNLDHDTDILRRKKATKSQVGLSKKSRAENVRYAFEVVDKSKTNGKNYLVFDDVWTSGATLRNCATTLKRAGARSVWGLTLARSR